MASAATCPHDPFLLSRQIVSLNPTLPRFHTVRLGGGRRCLLLLRTSPGYRRVSAEASTSGKGSLDNLATCFAETARAICDRPLRAFEDACLSAVKFGQSQDFPGKFKRTLKAANQKLDEIGYETRKKAEKLNRHYGISQRAQEAVNYARGQVHNIDETFRVTQKFRTASSDFDRNWPLYSRRLSEFLQTPVGRTLSSLALLWFLLSGWLFRIMFFAMWVLPLAAPLIINIVARNMIVEGTCPSCKRHFIGNRNQTVVCNYCRAVVWQPRQDFSSDESDSSIIDVDIE